MKQIVLFILILAATGCATLESNVPLADTEKVSLTVVQPISLLWKTDEGNEKVLDYEESMEAASLIIEKENDQLSDFYDVSFLDVPNENRSMVMQEIQHLFKAMQKKNRKKTLSLGRYLATYLNEEESDYFLLTLHTGFSQKRTRGSHTGAEKKVVGASGHFIYYKKWIPELSNVQVIVIEKRTMAMVYYQQSEMEEHPGNKHLLKNQVDNVLSEWCARKKIVAN